MPDDPMPQTVHALFCCGCAQEMEFHQLRTIATELRGTTIMHGQGAEYRCRGCGAVVSAMLKGWQYASIDEDEPLGDVLYIEEEVTQAERAGLGVGQ